MGLGPQSSMSNKLVCHSSHDLHDFSLAGSRIPVGDLYSDAKWKDASCIKLKLNSNWKRLSLRNFKQFCLPSTLMILGEFHYEWAIALLRSAIACKERSSMRDLATLLKWCRIGVEPIVLVPLSKLLYQGSENYWLRKLATGREVYVATMGEVS